MSESKFGRLEDYEHDYMQVGHIENILTVIRLRGFNFNSRHIALGVRAEILASMRRKFTDKPLLDILTGIGGPLMQFRGLGTQYFFGEAVSYPEDPQLVAAVKNRFEAALKKAMQFDPDALDCLRDFEKLGAKYAAFTQAQK